MRFSHIESFSVYWFPSHIVSLPLIRASTLEREALTLLGVVSTGFSTGVSTGVVGVI